MKPETDDTVDYPALLREICSLYADSRGSALKAYWMTGRRILELEGGRSLKERFGENIIGRLSADLSSRFGKGFSATNLKHMRRFGELFEFGQTSDQIDWSKYVELLSVEDEECRNALHRRLKEEHLPVSRLKMEIQAYRTAVQAALGKEGALRLSESRGTLYTYRVGSAEGVSLRKGELLADCGFNILRKIEVALTEKPQAGEIVRTEKRKERYHLAERGLKEPGDLYTYRAHLEHIIDGDTLRAIVDLGFRTAARRKFRLRGIDAPELEFPEGVKARKFVVKRLKESPVVVLRTHRADKYDRYVADLLYLPGVTDAERIVREGRFLNQELLDAGLALKV
jgi:endonuclease YncB( thermonuclease family)